MGTGGEVEFEIFSVLTAGIDTFTVIPSADLFRACANVVSVLVKSDTLVGILLNSRENDAARLGEGGLVVYVEGTFN